MSNVEISLHGIAKVSVQQQKSIFSGTPYKWLLVQAFDGEGNVLGELLCHNRSGLEEPIELEIKAPA